MFGTGLILSSKLIRAGVVRRDWQARRGWPRDFLDDLRQIE